MQRQPYPNGFLMLAVVRIRIVRNTHPRWHIIRKAEQTRVVQDVVRNGSYHLEKLAKYRIGLREHLSHRA